MYVSQRQRGNWNEQLGAADTGKEMRCGGWRRDGKSLRRVSRAWWLLNQAAKSKLHLTYANRSKKMTREEVDIAHNIAAHILAYLPPSVLLHEIGGWKRQRIVWTLFYTVKEWINVNFCLLTDFLLIFCSWCFALAFLSQRENLSIGNSPFKIWKSILFG